MTIWLTGAQAGFRSRASAWRDDIPVGTLHGRRTYDLTSPAGRSASTGGLRAARRSRANRCDETIRMAK